jgi:hypothetical protein
MPFKRESDAALREARIVSLQLIEELLRLLQLPRVLLAHPREIGRASGARARPRLLEVRRGLLDLASQLFGVRALFRKLLSFGVLRPGSVRDLVRELVERPRHVGVRRRRPLQPGASPHLAGRLFHAVRQPLLLELPGDISGALLLQAVLHAGGAIGESFLVAGQAAQGVAIGRISRASRATGASSTGGIVGQFVQLARNLTLRVGKLPRLELRVTKGATPLISSLGALRLQLALELVQLIGRLRALLARLTRVLLPQSIRGALHGFGHGPHRLTLCALRTL